VSDVDTRSSSTAPAEPQSRWAFPLHRIHWGQLAAALVALTAVTALVGWLLTDALAPNEITEFDDEVAQRLVDSRTATRTDAARWGAHIADTEVKIIVTALLAVGAIALWRRWHEALLIVAALVMEATAFIVASFIVARPRPNVPRLLDSPVDSSFPSGHVAAATVYSVVVVIVFRHTRSRLARASVVIDCVALPLVVGWARMYQGMHFLSDVVAGMILGVATVAVCALIIPRPTDSPTDPELAGRRVDADEPVATAAAD
jgi:undecaprenyl-diphosphatase